MQKSGPRTCASTADVGRQAPPERRLTWSDVAIENDSRLTSAAPFFTSLVRLTLSSMPKKNLSLPSYCCFDLVLSSLVWV